MRAGFCLRGVLPVLTMPLEVGERVDEPALRRQVRWVLAAGVQGVVVLGTAGEFVALADEEKRRAIAIVVEEVAGQVPVVAGTGEPATCRAVAMTQLAARLGADAALVVPPYYFTVDQAAVARHYRALAAEGGLPVLLYNIPFFTKVNLEFDTVRELAGVPGIAGIKDSSGNLRAFQRLAQSLRSERFCVLTGSDDLLFPQLLAGGDGIISPGANLAPQWFVALCAAYAAGRWEEAWGWQQRIQEMHRRIGHGAFPAGIKAALEALGIGSRRVAAPNVPANDAQAGEIAAALRELGLLPPAA